MKRPSEASPHPGRQLFDAALAGGAQASDAAIGGLAPDLHCDWVGLDTTNPDLPRTSSDVALEAWVFGPGRGAVKTVAVAGQVLVE